MKSEEEARRETDRLNNAAHAVDITPERMANIYDEWSDTYDMTMTQFYNGPRQAAEAAEEVVDEAAKATARVLDVAAGTGNVGRHLHQRGFRLIDALEPSKGMMSQLDKTGLYTNKFIEFVGHGYETQVPADTYDLVISSGGFGEGHIPVKGIDDMIRAAKPGGKVVIAMRRQYLDTVEMYRDRLEPHMARLEADGYWSKIARRVTPRYSLEKNDGIIYIYSVLKSSL